MRVRVKMCGITRPADAEAAAAAGADALGVVFHPRSPRAVDTALARDIAAAAGPFVAMVALFVDPAVALVERVLRELRPDLLQFHGAEPAGFCESFGVPYLKALRVGSAAPTATELSAHPAARGLLFDTLDPGSHGGTGRRFDWELLPAGASRHLVLAGGLEAGNVESAILRVRPWAVDVSSGIEASPGIKDAGRMRDFMRAVWRANATLRGPEGEQ